MKLQLFVAFALLALASSSLIDDLASYNLNFDEMLSLWTNWKEEHNVVYEDDSEEIKRFGIFIENYFKIHEFMKENPETILGVNKFANLTEQEFSDKIACHGMDSVPPENTCKGAPDNCPQFDTTNLPSTWNWADHGAVTPVKNQGDCGSCWSFSTTGSLEALYFFNHSSLKSFSEQQFVDCESNCDACMGCYIDTAMNWASNRYIQTEDSYPYRGSKGECQASNTTDGGYMVNNGCSCVTPKNIDQLKAAAKAQPVSISVQANQLAWQFYIGGVIKRFCGDRRDHAVLITGYGQRDGDNAWIIKNSWGHNWGVRGYVYILIDDKQNKGTGPCGVLAQPLIATNN